MLEGLSRVLSNRDSKQLKLDNSKQETPEKLFSRALTILKKPSGDRSQEDLTILLKVTSKIPFFEKLNSKKTSIESHTHQKCCRIMTHSTYQPGEAICFQGETGNEFYIILKGKVVALVLKDPETIRKEKEQKKLEKCEEESRSHSIVIPTKNYEGRYDEKHSEAVRQHLKAGFVKVTKLMKFFNMTSVHHDHNQAKNTIFLTESMKESISKNLPGLTNPRELRNAHLFFERQIFKYYSVSEMRDGNHFGELALIRKRPRAATVVCVEETELAMISKSDYESILLDIVQRKYQRQVEFFERILTCDIPKDTITRIAYMFGKRKYNFGDKIFSEGEVCKEFYVVKKGNVEISKSIKMKGNNEPEILKKETAVTGSIRIGVLTEGQVLGDQEIIFHSKRTLTATCISSPCTLLFVKREKIEKVLNDLPTLRDFFQSRSEMKDKWLKNTLPSRIDVKYQRVQEIQKEVPLNSFKIRPVLSELEDEQEFSTSPTSTRKQYNSTISEKIELKTYKMKNSLTFIRARQQKNRKNYSEYPIERNLGEVISQNEMTLKSLLNKNQQHAGDYDKGILESFEKNRMLVMARRGVINKHEELKAKTFFPYMADNTVSLVEKYKKKVERALQNTYEYQADYTSNNTLRIEGDLTSSFQKQNSNLHIPTLTLTQCLETNGSLNAGEDSFPLDSAKSGSEGHKNMANLKRIFEKYNTKGFPSIPPFNSKGKGEKQKVIFSDEPVTTTNWHVLKVKENSSKSLGASKKYFNKALTSEAFHKPYVNLQTSSFEHLPAEKRDSFTHNLGFQLSSSDQREKTEKTKIKSLRSIGNETSRVEKSGRTIKKFSLKSPSLAKSQTKKEFIF